MKKAKAAKRRAPRQQAGLPAAGKSAAQGGSGKAAAASTGSGKASSAPARRPRAPGDYRAKIRMYRQGLGDCKAVRVGHRDAGDHRLRSAVGRSRIHAGLRGRAQLNRRDNVMAEISVVGPQDGEPTLTGPATVRSLVHSACRAWTSG